MLREGSYMAASSIRVADRLPDGAFPMASRYNLVRTKTATALAALSSETSDLTPALTNRHAANALEAQNLFEHLKWTRLVRYGQPQRTCALSLSN